MKRAKFKLRPFIVLKIPYFCRPNYRARVAELVDALDSKSSSFGSASSIPASGTREEAFSKESPFFQKPKMQSFILDNQNEKS